VPAGTILRQQPAAGSTVREGKMVRVTLSQGGEIVVLPDVTGQSLRSAQITLRNHSLTLAEIENRPSVQYEKDTVISQSPPPNSIMKKNAPVRLVVSNGPPMDGSILMPDFVGKEWDDVVSWAANSGMQVKKIEDPKASASYGFIFKQSVKPDEVLEPNSTLVFTLSTNAAELPASKTLSFHFEVPQGDAAKLYSFVLVEPTKTQEIWKARLQPGSKHDISLPAKIAPNAKIRIFVNGILTEERNVQ
jgi:serine/threonine-protein kinase